MYRFALRPRWIVSHLLVLGLVIAMINLGLWQLRRLDERQARNDRVTERVVEPVASVADLAAGRSYADAEAVEFRRARANGRYEPDAEVFVRNRTLDGAAGSWVLTPLLLEDGRAVIVNRGWVPFELTQDDDLAEVVPIAGDVVVEGIARPPQQAQGLQSADPADGVLASLARVDLPRYQEQLPYEILPFYLQLESQEPAADALPIPVPRPDLDEGPHLGYAVQWFIFTTIAIVGYPLVLRKVARDADRPAPGLP